MNRDELIQLATEKKKKYRVKFLKEADDETIEKICLEYKMQQLDETNEQLSELLIGKFSDLLKKVELVDENCDINEKLIQNELFKNDLKNFVGNVTPYLP